MEIMKIEVKSTFPGDSEWGAFDGIWSAEETEEGLLIQCGDPDHQATIPADEKARFIEWLGGELKDDTEFVIGNDDRGASFELSAIEMKENTRVYMTYSKWSENDFFAETGWDSEEDILLEDFKAFREKLKKFL